MIRFGTFESFKFLYELERRLIFFYLSVLVFFFKILGQTIYFGECVHLYAQLMCLVTIVIKQKHVVWGSMFHVGY